MNHNIENRPEDTAVAESVDTRNWVSPRVDIAEDFDGLRVVASLPGVIHEDIEVTFEQGVLKIRARVREADEDRAYRVREFAPGGYERSFRIRETVDASKIEADYASGVLTLALPKRESARSRSIPVAAG